MLICIHIGMNKAGSSTIQSALRRNRAVLGRSGIGILQRGREGDKALVSLILSAPEALRFHADAGRKRPADVVAFVENARRDLHHALTARPWRKFVLSAESLCLHPDREAVARLQQLLAPYATGLRIIVYVREPLGYVRSLAQQRVKHGQTLAEVYSRRLAANYRRQIEKYIAVFGRDAVDIRVFDRGRFRDGDLVADFLEAIDEDPASLRLMRVRARNTAMSRRATVALSWLNARQPDSATRSLRAALVRHARFWLARMPGESYRLPDDVARRAWQASADDLCWLATTLGYEPFAGPGTLGAASRPQAASSE